MRAYSNGKGDCFKVAADLIVDSSLFKTDEESPNYVLIHALVNGRGKIEGVRFEHAFVLDLDTDMVIDKSNRIDVCIPRIFYYALGNVEEIGRYNGRQVRYMLVTHRTYGPWYDQENVEKFA